jgi:hypothetical protein
LVQDSGTRAIIYIEVLNLWGYFCSEDLSVGGS